MGVLVSFEELPALGTRLKCIQLHDITLYLIRDQQGVCKII